MCLDDLEKFYFEETSRQNSLGDSYFFGTTYRQIYHFKLLLCEKVNYRATSLDAFLYGYFWFIEKHPAFRDTHLFVSALLWCDFLLKDRVDDHPRTSKPSSLGRDCAPDFFLY
jgi:hypothetical protein